MFGLWVSGFGLGFRDCETVAFRNTIILPGVRGE